MVLRVTVPSVSISISLINSYLVFHLPFWLQFKHSNLSPIGYVSVWRHMSVFSAVALLLSRKSDQSQLTNFNRKLSFWTGSVYLLYLSDIQ
ncbi:protein of unknown function [Shewanella benthica]|uniref:Uncharacterized protein n=1 Tax=Shewanella benthica TaxID=43661 RepID=A0A330LZC0_9GAMM|nr:protein of unknown function [Shewanella benthica]